MEWLSIEAIYENKSHSQQPQWQHLSCLLASSLSFRSRVPHLKLCVRILKSVKKSATQMNVKRYKLFIWNKNKRKETCGQKDVCRILFSPCCHIHSQQNDSGGCDLIRCAICVRPSVFADFCVLLHCVCSVKNRYAIWNFPSVSNISYLLADYENLCGKHLYLYMCV